jgi:hypothetical protein
MSGITLVQAQGILDSLIIAQAAGVTGFSSVSIAGRTVTYSSAADLIALINYWSRVVNRLSGGGRAGFSVASFNPGYRCR